MIHVFETNRFVSGLTVKGCMVVVAEEMGKIDNDQAELLCRALTHMNGFEVAEACGLSPVREDDPGLTSVVISFIATEHGAVRDFRNGNPRAIESIIGKVMRMMPEADAASVRRMIEDRIVDVPACQPNW